MGVSRALLAITLTSLMIAIAIIALPPPMPARAQEYEEVPVSLNFWIRIEDERYEEGGLVSDWIEDYLHFKIIRQRKPRGVCIPAAYFTDPKWFVFNIYTAGWVSMAEWPYPEWSIAQMYAPWYGFMPGIQEPTWWNYQNETIDEVTLALCMGEVSPGEYWAKIREAVKLGIQESVRVFTAETWEFFPLNKENVHNVVAGNMSGLWPMWPLRTATTADGKLRVAEFSAVGQLFMSAWNPVLGFECVYSELMWRYVHDYGSYSDPRSGEPMPIRVHWAVEHGPLDVPETAMVYDPVDNQWESVGSGLKALVKVTLDYTFSNWHYSVMGADWAIPMTMADVLYDIGFMYEWSSNETAVTGEPDPFYHPRYAGRVAPTLEKIVGWEFVDEDTLVVYGNYTHPISDNVTADYYVVFPTVPWEVMSLMEYLVAYGAPETGTGYDWTEDEEEYIDMLTDSHVADMRDVAEGVKAKTLDHYEEFYPPYYCRLDPYTPSDAEIDKRYDAIIHWIDSYGHVVVSNGPYWVYEYVPPGSMTMKAFRDDTYPFTAEYWIDYWHDRNFIQFYDEDERNAVAGKRGPPLDEITWEVRMEQAAGILDTAAGTIDIFLWSSPLGVFLELPPEQLAKLNLVRASTGFWEIYLNPVEYNDLGLPGIVNVTEVDPEWVEYRDVGIYFNPYALRPVRYAMNWLINREYLITEVLRGSGAPMYSAVQPSEYANQFVKQVYDELGLIPEGHPEWAADLVNQTLQKIRPQLQAKGFDLYIKHWPDGDWWTLKVPLPAAPPPPGPPPARFPWEWLGAGIGVGLVIGAAASFIALRRRA